MKAILRTLKPTPLSIIFILLALLSQGVFFSSHTATSSFNSTVPEQSAGTFGLGSPITVIAGDGTTSYSIKWVVLALNLATTYVIGGLVAAGLTNATQLRRPAVAYSLVLAAALALVFVVSIMISRRLWGYFMVRPDLLSEVGEIAPVKAVVPLKTASDASGKRTIVPDRDFSLADSMATGKEDSYYCLSARILIELERRNLLPAAPATTLDGLPEFYSLIQTSSTLAKSSEGYDSSAELKGILIDAADKSGGRLVFLGLTGGQLSNDHYPYYEMLFRGRKDARELSFVHDQRFFYDVAGMEGFEWNSILLFLSVPGIVAAFVIFTIARVIWNWKFRQG